MQLLENFYKNKSILISVFCGALILMGMSFFNIYPLVTSDTGAYIGNIYEVLLPRDRPITYSIFLLFSSLKLSLWLTIFIQSAWLSYLIYLFLKIFINLDKHKWIHLYFISFLSLFTAVSWYSSQVMADIFSAIFWLNFMIIILYKHESKYLNWVLYFGLFASLLMHNSNMLTSFLLAFSLLIVSYFFYKTYFKKIIKVFFTTIAAIFFLSTAHLVGGYGFTLSQTTDVFLIAKLSENGVLKNYLDDKCPNSELKLCAYKESLPEHAWDYIWTDSGPFYAIGWWTDSKTEHTKILKDVFTSTKYLSLFAKKSVQDGWVQFFSYQVGDGLFQNLEPSNAFYQVQKFYRKELKLYINSKQNRSVLTFDMFNKIYCITLLLSTLGLFFAMVFVKVENFNKSLIFVLVSLILFLLLNAFLTANLANVLARLQSRVLWLWPLFCWVYIFCKYNYYILAKSKQ